MKTASSFGSTFTAGTGGSGSVDGVIISLLRSFLAVDLLGVMVSGITGVAGSSSGMSAARGIFLSDLGAVLLEAVDGVAGAFPSSVSTVDPLVLRLGRPLRPPVVVDTVEGVGGGGIDSRSPYSRWSS